MPTESSFASVEIPDVDLWGFMFERKDRGFADDQGRSSRPAQLCVVCNIKQ